MEGERRDQKLKAGKEKLAKFQRKKRKKKPPTDATGSVVHEKDAHASSPPLEAVSDTGFMFDSDTMTTSSCSEDDTDSAQEWSSRAQLQLKSKLQEKSQRVEELEESLVGKQLALDKVIQENEKLKTLTSQVQPARISDANHNAVASNQGSSHVNGTTENQSPEAGTPTDTVSNEAGTPTDTVSNEAGSQEFSMSDVQELLHHVQWLKMQLKQANNTLQTQTEKQRETVGALHNAKDEINLLQDSITQKDKLLNELIGKMKQISTEYESFKKHYAEKAENQNDNLIHELESQCKTVDEMNIALKAELQKVQNEKENEIQQLLEKQRVQIDQLTQSYEVKMEELESELNEVRSKNQEQQLSLDKILNENEGLQSYCDTLTKGLEFLKDEHEKAVAELNDLSAEFKVLKSEYDVLVEDKCQCELQIESWVTKFDIVNAEKGHILDELKELTNANGMLEKELAAANQSFESLKQEHQNYFQDNTVLANELTKNKEDNLMYQSQIAEYERKLSESGEILEENHSLHVQNDELNNRINNQKDVIASLKNELEVLTVENSQFVEKVNDLTTQYQSVDAESCELKIEKEQALNQVKILKEQLLHLEEENREYKDNQLVLEEEIQKLKQCMVETQIESSAGVSSFMAKTKGKSDLSGTAMHNETDENQSQGKPVGEIEEIIVPHEILCRSEVVPQVYNEPDRNKRLFEQKLSETDELDSVCCVDDKELVKEESDTVESAKLPNVSQSYMNDYAKVEELEGEIKRLNDIIIELQASVLSKDILASAQKLAQSAASDDLTVSDYKTNKMSSQTNNEDTAYESDHEQPEKLKTEEVDILTKSLADTKQELDRVTQMLQEKTLECEEVKLKYLNRDKKPIEAPLYVTIQDMPSEVSEVSETSSVTSLEKEVNLHASSSFCLVPNDGVVTLDSLPGVECKGDSELCLYKDTFQNESKEPVHAGIQQAFGDCEVSDNVADGRNLIKGHIKVKEQIMPDQTETVKLSDLRGEVDRQSRASIESVEQVKETVKTIEPKLEEKKDVIADLKDENKTLEAVNAELQMKLRGLEDMKLKERVDTLGNENEKLIWERDQLLETLNELEKEMLDMKSSKCDIEFQKIQYEEELNRVKERLEYLESSDHDIIEIKDMLEKVQEERVNILLENEKLQCELSAQIEEKENLLQCFDLLQKEKASCSNELELLKTSSIDIKTEHEVCKSVKEMLEKKIEETLSEKLSQELKFEGEIDGLLEENSTLKTCIRMKDSEIDNLETEIERLNSFFPNIDEHTENSYLLKTKNAELEDRLNEMTQENESLVSELIETQGKVAEAAGENELLLDKCDEFQRVINELDEEKTSLLDSVQRTREKISAQLEENGNLIEKYEIQLECLDQENSTLKTQLLSFKQEIDEKSKDDNVKESETLKREIGLLKEENVQYQKGMNDFKQALSVVEEKVKLQHDALEESETLTVKVETENQELTTENARLKDKYISVESDLNDLKENEAYLKEQMKIYESAINSEGEEKGLEVERLNAQLELEKKYKNKLQKDVEHVQKVMLLLESDNIKITENADSIQKELNIEHEKNVDLREHLNKTEHELENALIAKQSVSKEKDEISKNLNEVMKLNEELKTKLTTLQNHLQAVSDNRNHIRCQIEILVADIENLQQANDSLEIRNRDFQFGCERNSAENKALKEEKETLILENMKTKKEMEKIQEEYELFKQGGQMSEDSSYEDINVVKEEVNQLFNENDMLRQENDTLKAELQCKLQEVENTGEIVDENIRLSSENEDLQKENEELRSKFLLLRDKMVSLDELIERNKAAEIDNETLCERLDTLYKRIGEIKKEKEALQKMTDDLTNMLHDMQTKYEEVKSEMESTKKKCDKEIEHLQNQLYEMNDDVSELRKVLDYMETEMFSTTEEKNILKENLEKQQCEFAAVVEQKQRLEEILSDKQQKDIKNMQMASQRQKNNSSIRSRCEPEIPSNELVCSESEIEQVTSSHIESEEETDQDASETLGDSMDGDLSDLVPSFESAMHLLGLATSSEMNVTSRIVQTNMSFSGYENIGFLIDDNGEKTENRKDLAMTDCETQTERLTTESETENFNVTSPNFDRPEIILEFPVCEIDKNVTSSSSETCQNVSDIVGSSPSHNVEEASLFDVTNSNQLEHKSVSVESTELNENGQMNTETKIKFNNSSQTEIQSTSVSCQYDLQIQQSLQSLFGESAHIETDTEGNVLDTCAGNSSVMSSDSGILSASICMDRKDQPFMYPEYHDVNDEQNSNLQNRTVTSVQSEDIEGIDITDQVENAVVSVQTDFAFDEEIEKALENIKDKLKAEHEIEAQELEAEIEARILKNLEIREQKVQSLEENYERKVKQTEYDMEEKYEQMFRVREVDIVMEADRDKKTHAAQVENAAEIKIEQIKREKDQQFVETLQKVKADFVKKHRRESGEMRRAKSYDVRHRDTDLDVGPDGDGYGEHIDSMQDLAIQNQKLAKTKDELQLKIHTSQQGEKAFCRELLGIMGDRNIMGNDDQTKTQQAPSWLDWDLSPELSFGSLRSSLDTKSLSGELDPSTFCSNADCLKLRIRYEQLTEKIQQYLKVKTSHAQSDQAEATSKPEVDKSVEKNDTDKDMFVEHEEDLSHMLYRGTSMDLEHCFRIPYKSTEYSDDQFVQEDGRDAIEINSEVIDILVQDSQGPAADEHNFEGHFSENEESDEDDDQGGKVEQLRDSTSFVEERGSFCAEENFQLVRNKRHFSESDIKVGESETRNLTSQSDNLEGHFVLERCESQVDADQKLKNEDSQVAGNAGEDKNNDGVFEEMENCEVSSVFVEKNQSSTFVSENDTFINESNDDKAPGLEDFAFSRKPESVTGEETGDFFEEKIVQSVIMNTGSTNSADQAIKGLSLRKDLVNAPQSPITGEETGDFFEEKIVQSVIMNTGSTNSADQAIKGLSLRKDLVNAPQSPITGEETGDFFEEKIVQSVIMNTGSTNSADQAIKGLSLRKDLVNVSQSLDSDLSSVKQEYKKGQQSYENTVFDILNAICPGTNPGRKPSASGSAEDLFQPVSKEIEDGDDDLGDFHSSNEVDSSKLKAELGNMKLELQSLTKENINLKEAIKRRETDNEKIMEALEIRVEEVESTRDDQKDVSQQAKEQLFDEDYSKEKSINLELANEELLDSLKECKKQIATLQSELDEKTEMDNEIDALESKLKCEINRGTSLHLKYTEIKDAKDEFERKFQNVSLQNERLKADVHEFESSSKKMKEEMLTLREEQSKLNEVNSSLKDMIAKNDELIKEQEQLKHHVCDVLKHNEKLKDQVREQQRKTDELEKTLIVQTKEQVDKLYEEKKELENALIAQADVCDGFEKSIKDLEKEKNKLEKLIEAKKKKIQILKETYEMQMDENKILKEELENEKEMKNTCKLKSDELASGISVLRSQKYELDIQHANMTSENDNLKASVKHLETDVKLLKDEKGILNTTIRDIEGKIDEVETQLEDKKATVEELCISNQELVQQVSKFEEDANTLQLVVAEMTDKVNILTEENKMLQGLQVEFSDSQVENKSLKLELNQMKERNEENEWAIRELAKQVEERKSDEVVYVDRSTEMENIDSFEKSVADQLREAHSEDKICCTDKSTNTDTHFASEEEVNDLKEQLGALEIENSALKQKFDEVSNEVVSDQEVEALRLENETLKRSLDVAMVRDDSDTDMQIFEDMKDALRTMQAEKSSAEQNEKDMCENLEHENKRLRDEIEELYTENDELKKKLKTQEELARKESGEILKMYSDLRNEVEVLVISKHDLEIELHALKDLLEHDPYQAERTDHDTSKQLTLQDLKEMEELKASIEKLKSDLKERDSYVRKLEEHLLGMDGSIPELTSTPKPLHSRGMPFISKSLSKRGKNLSGFGRRSYSYDIPTITVARDLSDSISAKPELERSQTLDTSLHVDDLSNSRNTEKHFVEGLKQEKLTSSVLSDSLSTTSQRGSFAGSGRIRSGLKAEEDGHLALELKQFELVAEITKLRRDFRETKALYSKETALLSEALEKEKLANELRGMPDLNLEHNVGSNFSHDLLKLRKEVGRLREQNRLLTLDCDRWVERLKEQEDIVSNLKQRLSQNTSGFGEIEEVFGRQLALLQKQREELIDQLKDRETENSLLSENLGEKGIIEETLRKEKYILSAKLKEKERVEDELIEKKQLLEKQIAKQKGLEDVVYQKDLNEIELMKQKRILEEELREIESRFRDKEENLDFEKNKLLTEMKEKRTKAFKSRFSESDDEVSSVCSESAAFSDRNIGRLEVMLEKVEKQHSVAVNVLRDQLSVKYRRREKELRQEHAEGITRLKQDSKNQVN